MYDGYTVVNMSPGLARAAELSAAQAVFLRRPLANVFDGQPAVNCRVPIARHRVPKSSTRFDIAPGTGISQSGLLAMAFI